MSWRGKAARLLPWVGLLLGMALVYRALLRGQVLAGRDAFRIFFPDSAFLLEALRAGEIPLWTPYPRLGQPFAATLYSQVFYPPRLLTVLLAGPVLGFTLQHLLHVGIAAAGTGCSRVTWAPRAPRPWWARPPSRSRRPSRRSPPSRTWPAPPRGRASCCSPRAGRARPSPRSAARVALFAGLSFLAGSPETGCGRPHSPSS
ncbi:hypothetical protein ACN28S_37180 [Cystobacter fuscus]